MSAERGANLLVLRDAAESAVDTASRWLEAAGPEAFQRHFKPSGEELTLADLAVEAAVQKALAALTPEIPVVSEESTRSAEVPSQYWLLDPIDGTINLARGAPYYAVSLAYVDAGVPVVGAVCAPALRVRASACLEGQPTLHPVGPDLTRAIIGVTGGGASRSPKVAELIAALFRGAGRVRLQGSMCLDLFATAEGWLDACVCVRPKPWDVAAGIVLARAKGLAVLGAGGVEYVWASPYLVAGPPTLVTELLDLVAAVLE